MDEQAWTDNPRVLLDRRVLAHLVEGPSKMNYPDVAATLDADEEEVARAFLSLEASGLVTTGDHRMSLKYPFSAAATVNGRNLAATWDAKATGGSLKRSCIAAMLAWLDANDGDRIFGTDKFREDVRAYCYAVPFPEDLTVTAARTLKDRDLIKGTATWGGPVLRPEITPLGTAVLTNYGGDLAAWEGRVQGTPGSINVNVHGSTGVAVSANSPGSQQTVHASSNRSEQVLNFARAVEQATPVLGLTPEAVEQVLELVRDLRDSADAADTEPERPLRIIEALKAIVVSGSGSALGQGLIALGDQVAQAF